MQRLAQLATELEQAYQRWDELETLAQEARAVEAEKWRLKWDLRKRNGGPLCVLRDCMKYQTREGLGLLIKKCAVYRVVIE